MITSHDLRQLTFFADLDPAGHEELALVAADVYLNAGDWLIQEGDTGAFFVLLKGELEVRKETAGAEHVITRYLPGEAFGEVPLLLGSGAVASIRAEKNSRVMRLEAPDFYALMARSDAVASRVLRNMTRRVGDLQRLAVETPQAVTLLIGGRAESGCAELRDFLARNQIAFRWLDPEEPALAALIPPEVAHLPQPTVILPSGEVLTRPSLRNLAVQVGLQVRPERPEYDIVILGGGPAGLAAAVYGASEGLCTLLIEKHAPGGQAGTSSRIENYLGFPTGLSGDDLSARALRQARRFGAEVVTTREAVALTPSPTPGTGCHTVTLDGSAGEGGERLQARTVIVSTGVEWRPLPLAGAKALSGRGVWYGAARTEAPGTRGKDVYLIGGGNSAGQAAMHFSGYAERVSLLIRGPSLEAGMSQYLIDQLRGKANVRVCLSCEVVALHGETQLTGLTVRHAHAAEEQIETDALFVFIGADARTDWLPEALVRESRGYVLTGSAVAAPHWPLKRAPLLLETSVPGIFAAGDVRHDSVKRVASSVGEGSMAVALIHHYLGLHP
ncbi:cyclic nucleotide-binding domain-containing protein [Deinococcus sp. Arct2-2]|uniref:FAD-dependent oxidoreductase n=1 Tax=Deinococcus sp. Arct2-2 TaxID=2568653 RepID=UPI0010A3ADCA|nr:FAD-dependent oxidoreductase [Deinococcus sp. Arct2-2]THF71682.1 cyclic nucleotide-binding domain-containing protein [Deinococcus sp. Arct2-2]